MSTTGTRPIAVFGGTGQQGGSVIDALLSEGANVRALVRDTTSERAQALAARGVTLVQADVDDTSSLDTALDGVSAFFFMTTPPGGMQSGDLEGETRLGVTLGDAAARAKVPHTVFSSVGGAERNSGVPHFESKRRVEEHLQSLGINLTIVRPVFFAENLAFTGPKPENDEYVLRLPLPDGIPLQMVAVRDIGKVAAAALLRPSELPAEIEIAGDERTGSQIAEAFAQHLGKAVRYEALPIEALQGQDDTEAMFRWFAETPAYQGDIEQIRSIAPDVWDLPTWLATTGYQATA